MTLRSEAEIEALVAVPTPPPPTPVDARPCAVCGIAVGAGEHSGPVEYRDTTRYTASGNVVGGVQTWVEMTLCPRCWAAEARAAALVDSHPGLPRALGPAGATRVTSSVVMALDYLAVTAPRPDVDDEELGALVRHLGTVGELLAYRRVATDVGASYRWAHVPLAAREQVRTAYAGVLAERVAATRPPVAIGPPTGGDGCLLCGVGAVLVPARDVVRFGGPESAAGSVWRSVSTTPSALGGSGSDRVAGHVCPVCAKAIEDQSSVGPTSLAAALVAYLRVSGAEQVARAVAQADVDGGVRGLVGWGATRLPPNERPWGHLELPEN
jgi:hypothetical protein